MTLGGGASLIINIVLALIDLRLFLAIAGEMPTMDSVTHASILYVSDLGLFATTTSMAFSSEETLHAW